jgi:hypothetical protein
MAVHAARGSRRFGANMSGLCGVAAGIGLMLAGMQGALGEEFRGTEAQQQACMPDVFRLCSAHIPNVAEIVACMRHERRNLSSECRSAFYAERPTMDAKVRTRAHHAHHAHHAERRVVRNER